MTTADAARQWYPTDRDYRAIWDHLARQTGLDQRIQVRLDNGAVVPVGADAEGEADDHHR